MSLPAATDHLAHARHACTPCPYDAGPYGPPVCLPVRPPAVRPFLRVRRTAPARRAIVTSRSSWRSWRLGASCRVVAPQLARARRWGGAALNISARFRQHAAQSQSRFTVIDVGLQVGYAGISAAASPSRASGPSDASLRSLPSLLAAAPERAAEHLTRQGDKSHRNTA